MVFVVGVAVVVVVVVVVGVVAWYYVIYGPTACCRRPHFNLSALKVQGSGFQLVGTGIRVY